MGYRLARAAGGSLLAAMVLGLLLVGLAHLVPLPERAQRPSSPLMLDRDGGWLRVQVTPDDGGMVRIPVRRAEIPEPLVQALLNFEDRRYHWHLGVDPLAMARAAWSNLWAGRVVSGGSTITMQVARMLERRPRTMRAKVREMLRAVQLELRYSKDEILEMYFNLAPYGGNLEGVGTASYYYYEKDVSKLRLDEIATLVALPNSPTLLNPKRGKDRLRRRRNDVLARMAEDGLIERERAEAAAALPVHAERRPVPFLAPHLAQAMLKAHPEELRFHTSIDRELQLRLERLLAEHVRRLSAYGITNGAVVLIENQTRKVRAYVGSASFFDAVHDGQVDGAQALRSPGSTLKPFVYALGLDRGLIGVNTLLEDVPLNYKDWSPANFDGKWHGVVPAKDALARSLNVPAVRLAEKLEPNGLVHLLGEAGFRTVTASPNRYGLASVLGGVDVSLLELTNLYATLASGGAHRRPIFLEEDSSTEPARQLFSPGAAYLVADILTDVRRPELPDSWKDAVSMPRVAWKTGTSYGHRDAWSVGFTSRWTVGVWVGNFDGAGVPELIGVEAAAPLLFTIALGLPGVSSDPWFDRPGAVGTRTVCALSGELPEPSCPHRQTELALIERAPTQRCKLHQRIDVDDDSGHRLCSHCRQGRNYHPETHVVWPASVAAYLAEAGVAVERVPSHEPSCTHGMSGDAPEVRSPADGDQFVLRPGVPLEHQQIALIASTQGGSDELYWFVDEQLVATVKPGTPVMIAPVPGSHRLVAMDREGRRSQVSIGVREAD